MSNVSNVLPDNIMAALLASDEANGFPKGTMYKVMMTEVGGNLGTYLNDPTKYHYPLNAEGKRIAGHTGKVSTAFGPFGILESTGRDPGYGVKPLQNKTLEEQIRFAGDLLGAYTKRAGGSLEKGLAQYGEGAKYASKVLGKVIPNPKAIENHYGNNVGIEVPPKPSQLNEPVPSQYNPYRAAEWERFRVAYDAERRNALASQMLDKGVNESSHGLLQDSLSKIGTGANNFLNKVASHTNQMVNWGKTTSNKQPQTKRIGWRWI